MTCPFANRLIGDLVDGELSPAEVEQVRQHLEPCRRCREQHQETLRLTELLGHVPTFDPDPDYWSETSSIIRARTIASPVRRETYSPISEKAPPGRHALMRSSVSVMASLFLLVSAVLVGSSHEKRISRLNVVEAPILATAPVSELLADDQVPVVTRAEQVRLAKGTLLMGNPGFLGRFVGLSDLMPTSE